MCNLFPSPLSADLPEGLVIEVFEWQGNAQPIDFVFVT